MDKQYKVYVYGGQLEQPFWLCDEEIYSLKEAVNLLEFIDYKTKFVIISADKDGRITIEKQGKVSKKLLREYNEYRSND